MKKLISLFMVLAIVCLFGGCKSEVKEDVSSDNPVEAEENVEDAANDENTPSEVSNEDKSFETKNGKIKFVGVEKAETDITSEENAYVVKFEVTNKASEARTGYEIFRTNIYQNNVEVNYINTLTVTGSEQYNILDNGTKSIMKDGTLVTGELVVLDAKAPLTISFADDMEPYAEKSITVSID